MARRKHDRHPPNFAELATILPGKVRAPLGVVLGSPREVADCLAVLQIPDAVCYQMDLYQAERLREELSARGVSARVMTAPDLWDLPGPFRTLVYPVPQ